MKYVLLAFFILSCKSVWWSLSLLSITPRYLKFLESRGLRNSSTSTIYPDCTVRLCLFPKMEKHHRGQRFHSSKDVRNEAGKWLPAQDTFFVCLKDLPDWYTAMRIVWRDLMIIWRSKANLRLCHSIITCSVCCYLFK